jgi:hypothetical protein
LCAIAQNIVIELLEFVHNPFVGGVGADVAAPVIPRSLAVATFDQCGLRARIVRAKNAQQSASLNGAGLKPKRAPA